MKLTRIFMMVVPLCVLFASACSDDDPRSEIPNLTLADFAGRWNCSVETWDLTQKGICTEIDPSNQRAIKGADGKNVTLTIGEYCRSFAEAYNAKYGPAYTITPEEVAVREVENPEEEDYCYFTFDRQGAFEFHVCQTMAGIGHFNTLAIMGDVTYYPESSTLTLIDKSTENNPRRMVLTLKKYTTEEMVLSIVDEYPWFVSDFDGKHAYQVECTTLYTGRKVTE